MVLFRSYVNVYQRVALEMMKPGMPRVNVDIPNWKDSPFSNGKSTISMAIFHSHSYVDLPGIGDYRW